MQPFIVTIEGNSRFLVLPDSEAHVDGHPILTYTYSLFKSGDNLPDAADIVKKQGVRRLSSSPDQDYLGYVTIELPGKLVSYTPNESQRLNMEEIEQVVERISHMRNTPDEWPKSWVTGN